MPVDGDDPVRLLALRKEIWDRTVQTQMHFNEMSVKSRQLGLSFVVAALGLAVVTLTREEGVTISVELYQRTIQTHVSGLIVLVAAFGLWAVKMLDLNVYHRMLRGAVAFGEELETTSLRDDLMGTSKGMTEMITFYSQHRVVTKHLEERRTRHEGKRFITAHSKIGRFYNMTFLSLILISITLLWVFGSTSPAPLS